MQLMAAMLSAGAAAGCRLLYPKSCRMASPRTVSPSPTRSA